MNSIRTYAVTAATGHVGGHAVRQLLEAGQRVRAMGRDADRLKELDAPGVELFAGDLMDQGFVEHAFSGVDGALLIVPPHPAVPDFPGYQRAVADIYSSAAAATGLRHAVSISVLGANDGRAGGLIEGHANIESSLNKTPDLNIVHVHPSSFFEILYYYLQPLREDGVLRTPLGVDARLQLVSARDVGATAARLLADLHFRGISNAPVYPIRPISVRQIAELLTFYSGRSFGVEQVSAEADVDDLVASGTGRSFARLLNETWALATAMGEAPDPAPYPATTARYRIEDFIRDELVPAIRSSQPISDYSTATRPRGAA